MLDRQDLQNWYRFRWGNFRRIFFGYLQLMFCFKAALLTGLWPCKPQLCVDRERPPPPTSTLPDVSFLISSKVLAGAQAVYLVERDKSYSGLLWKAGKGREANTDEKTFIVYRYCIQGSIFSSENDIYPPPLSENDFSTPLPTHGFFYSYIAFLSQLFLILHLLPSYFLFLFFLSPFFLFYFLISFFLPLLIFSPK
jgi:hypothetical protein